LEENSFERLGEDVGLLVGGGYLLKSEDVGGNLLLKVVVFDIDVLCAFGGAFAPGHVDSALVVYAGAIVVC
jgi:hypothetical protein